MSSALVTGALTLGGVGVGMLLQQMRTNGRAKRPKPLDGESHRREVVEALNSESRTKLEAEIDDAVQLSNAAATMQYMLGTTADPTPEAIVKFGQDLLRKHGLKTDNPDPYGPPKYLNLDFFEDDDLKEIVRQLRSVRRVIYEQLNKGGEAPMLVSQLSQLVPELDGLTRDMTMRERELLRMGKAI